MGRFLLYIILASIFLTTACFRSEPGHSLIKEEDVNHLEEDENLNAFDLDDKEDSEGFFWEVNNDETTVYLLGSFHIGTNNMFPMRNDIEEAFQSADYLALEIDYTSEDIKELMEHFVLLQYNPENLSLQDKISESLYNDLNHILPRFDLSSEDIDDLKPWALFILLEELYMQEINDFDMGVEEYFLSNKPEQMTVKSLEEEVAITYLDELPDEEQISLLESKVKEIKTNHNVYEYPIELWKTGNYQAFEEWINNTYFDEENYFAEERLENFVNKLLVERNHTMANRIMEFLYSENENNFFVIVGAAHFFGEENIIQILEDAGFNVITH